MSKELLDLMFPTKKSKPAWMDEKYADGFVQRTTKPVTGNGLNNPAPSNGSAAGIPKPSIKRVESTKPVTGASLDTGMPDISSSNDLAKPSIKGSKLDMGKMKAAASLINAFLPGTGHAGRDTATSMITAINPFVGTGIKMADTLWKGLGIAPDSLDPNAMSRFDLSGVNKANEIANTLFLGLPAFSKTLNVRKGDATTRRAGSYQAVNSNVDAAVALSGKNVYFGGSSIRSAQRETMRQQDKVDQIDSNARRYAGNIAGELQAYQNDMLFNGYTPKLSLAKSGIKMPALEEARVILNSIKKFKVGGKFEPNVIPIGELHKNKHHLEEVNPDLEGEITTKGIPVISVDEDGDVTQHAEIEKEEITFSISVTEQLEKFYSEYIKNPSDEIAIECGKFLTEQILKNTIDEGELIKNIE